MVTITNGVKTFRVTTGSVAPYESMGFHIVSDEELKENQIQQEYDVSNNKHNKKDIVGDVENKDVIEEDDTFIGELLEKPLSQWTNEEVKEFVKIRNIDTSGAQKISQVRGIIKTYLEEEQKNTSI